MAPPRGTAVLAEEPGKCISVRNILGDPSAERRPSDLKDLPRCLGLICSKHGSSTRNGSFGRGARQVHFSPKHPRRSFGRKKAFRSEGSPAMSRTNLLQTWLLHEERQFWPRSPASAFQSETSSEILRPKEGLQI